jgi:hypothetical protein
MKQPRTLTLKEIQALPAGTVTAAGGVNGLYIIKSKSDSKSGRWIYRYRVPGRKSCRDMGLGSFPEVSLQSARHKAKAAEITRATGQDPIEQRRAAIEEKKKLSEFDQIPTFEELARKWIDGYYFPKVSQTFREPITQTKKAERQLQKWVFPVVGSIRFDQLTTKDLNKVVALFPNKSSSLNFIASVLRSICRYGVLKGIRDDGINPALGLDVSLRGELVTKTAKDSPETETRSNFAACPVDQIPALIRVLQDTNTPTARAAIFSILTAARSQAVRLAQWKEIDLSAKVWNIPLEHNKIKKLSAVRTIVLSDTAVSFLKSLPEYQANEVTPDALLFPSRGNKPLSPYTIDKLFQNLHQRKIAIDGIGWIDTEKQKKGFTKDLRITLHGTARATFRTWTQNSDNLKRFDQGAAELCLLHDISKYQGAYERNPRIEERRKIMNAWGLVCIPDSTRQAETK